MSHALEGRIAWVTGGSGGIGTSVVESLRSAGSTVLSTDLTVPGSADTEPGVVHRRCDVTDAAEIEAAVAFCVAEMGGLDILVNVAGIQRRADIFDVTPEMWSSLMAVNLGSYFFCAQAAARAMVANGSPGAIINMSSINSDHVRANTIPYCTSKGGVKTLTMALAVALGQYGIRVNGIAPGAIDTSFTRDRLAIPRVRESIEARTPLGRVGRPSDIGPAVVYLASEQASFVTGAILEIHGGRVLTA